MMVIAPNSHTCKEEERGEVMGSMEEFEVRRRGMLTAGEWCKMSHYIGRGRVGKGLGTRGLIIVAAFDNSGSV